MYIRLAATVLLMIAACAKVIAQPYQIRVTHDTNLRTSYSLDSAVLATAPAGSTLQVVGHYADWLTIDRDGATVWMADWVEHTRLDPAHVSASVCTLADRIRSANTNTAVGFCPAGTSHDIITITEDIVLAEPLPPITGTITIEGGGHTISGANKFSIFVVNGGRFAINNLKLAQGASEFDSSGPGADAGAITALNHAEILVNQVEFSRNYSGGTGGAIAVFYSELTVNDSSFMYNHATGGGGAIFLWQSTGAVSNSSFVSNSASHLEMGGAILVGMGVELDVRNSSFSGNSARKGGALASHVWMPDGPILSTTTLTHVTLMNNQAMEAGNGISIHDSDRNFNLRNSIVAGAIIGNCQGVLNENIGNLIADGSCGAQNSGDARIGELTGAPAYHPLLDGSPAIDTADSRFCTETDQLGTPRPQGGGCDIGAIEARRGSLAIFQQHPQRQLVGDRRRQLHPE